jgi:nitrogen fixation NifU-like protein
MGGALPYGTTVLEHFKRPRNQRTLERPTVTHDGYNPLCGDRVRIELEIDQRVILEAAFTANACAICTASASLLTELVTGVSVGAAARLSDDEIVTALGAEIPAGRLACATLPLRALHQALAELRPPA